MNVGKLIKHHESVISGLAKGVAEYLTEGDPANTARLAEIKKQIGLIVEEYAAIRVIRASVKQASSSVRRRQRKV